MNLKIDRAKTKLVQLEESHQRKLNELEADYLKKAGEQNSVILVSELKVKGLENAAKKLEGKIAEGNESLENVIEKKRTISTTVDNLIATSTSIQEEISIANSDLDTINKKKDAILTEINELNVTLENKKTETNNAEIQLNDIHKNLKEFQKHFDKQKAQGEDELKAIYAKASEVTAIYKDLQEKSSEIRKDLADRTKALDRREEVIKRKEALLSDAENRVKEYNRYMKL